MSTNSFISPPTYNSGTASNYSLNQVYALNDQIPITWVTNSESYYFQLYQMVPALNSANNGTKIFSTSYAPSNPNQVQSFNWTVSIYPFNLSFYPVFYIQCDNLTGGPLFLSQPFNITAAQTSLPSSSATASPTNVPGGSTSPVGVLGSSSSSTNGLSTGAQAGIGIAVVLVALGLIALALVVGYRRGQQHSRRIVKHSAGEDPNDILPPPGTSSSNEALRNMSLAEIYTAEDDTKHVAYAGHYKTPPQPLQDLKPLSTPYARPIQPPKSRYNVRSPEPGYFEIEGAAVSVRPELP